MGKEDRVEALFLIQRPDIDQPAGEDDGSEHASLHLNCIYVNLIQLFLPRLQRLTFFPLLVSIAATIFLFLCPHRYYLNWYAYRYRAREEPFCFLQKKNCRKIFTQKIIPLFRHAKNQTERLNLNLALEHNHPTVERLDKIT